MNIQKTLCLILGFSLSLTPLAVADNFGACTVKNGCLHCTAMAHQTVETACNADSTPLPCCTETASTPCDIVKKSTVNGIYDLLHARRNSHGNTDNFSALKLQTRHQNDMVIVIQSPPDAPAHPLSTPIYLKNHSLLF